MNVTLVCVGIEHEGNAGAVARCMKNFGVEDLILVDPQIDHCSITSLVRATHAEDILKNARLEKNLEFLKEFDHVIGTTARLGTDYNVPRLSLTPKQLVSKLESCKGQKVALVIGREGTGLHNEELAYCDFTVSIPTSSEHRSLNISHACTVLLYELFPLQEKKAITDHIRLASRDNKDQILTLLDEALEFLNFITPDKKETQRKVWKNIFNKSFLTKREAFAVMGFFKRVLGKR
jgi:tRNA/rRNA methyltransferase